MSGGIERIWKKVAHQPKGWIPNKMNFSCTISKWLFFFYNKHNLGDIYIYIIII